LWPDASFYTQSASKYDFGLDLLGAYGASPDSVVGLYGYCGKGGEVRKMGRSGWKREGRVVLGTSLFFVDNSCCLLT